MKKICGHCKEFKLLSEFGKNVSTSTGLSSYCFICRSQARRKWRVENREKVNKDRASWRKKNREKRKKIEETWRAKNKDRYSAMIKEWARLHPEKRRESSAKYAKLHPAKNALNHRRYVSARHIAMPLWANEFFMDEAYDLARIRTKKTKIKWVVDHIVPLRSKSVCGLHTDANLQVIPFVTNAAKGNRFWPDMPL